MDIRGGNNITRLLRMRGKKRLGVKNHMTDWILEEPYYLQTGINLRFLESKRMVTETGEWEEYSVLYEVKKIKESPQYLSEVLKIIGQLLDRIGKSNLEIESMGIQEVECGLSDYYYVLIYIINNGKDKEGENENNFGGEFSDYE